MVAAAAGSTMERAGAGGDDAPLVLVDLLATWPGVRARLLTEHTHDGHGHCRGCRVPGYGTPGGHWPCRLATLARAAQQRVGIAEA